MANPVLLPFPKSPSVSSVTYTHENTLVYAHTRITHTLSAPGCQDTGEWQHYHCIVLYYTWNSEPHAFLIKVICTGPACVTVFSVSESYKPLSTFLSQGAIAHLRTRKPQTLVQKIKRWYCFSSHTMTWEEKGDVLCSLIHCATPRVQFSSLWDHWVPKCPLKAGESWDVRSLKSSVIFHNLYFIPIGKSLWVCKAICKKHMAVGRQRRGYISMLFCRTNLQVYHLLTMKCGFVCGVCSFHTWLVYSSHLDPWQWRHQPALQFWHPPVLPIQYPLQAERVVVHQRLTHWPAQWSGHGKSPGRQSGGRRACWLPPRQHCVCACSQSPEAEKQYLRGKCRWLQLHWCKEWDWRNSGMIETIYSLFVIVVCCQLQCCL